MTKNVAALLAFLLPSLLVACMDAQSSEPPGSIDMSLISPAELAAVQSFDRIRMRKVTNADDAGYQVCEHSLSGSLKGCAPVESITFAP